MLSQQISRMIRANHMYRTYRYSGAPTTQEHEKLKRTCSWQTPMRLLCMISCGGAGSLPKHLLRTCKHTAGRSRSYTHWATYRNSTLSNVTFSQSTAPRSTNSKRPRQILSTGHRSLRISIDILLERQNHSSSHLCFEIITTKRKWGNTCWELRYCWRFFSGGFGYVPNEMMKNEKYRFEMQTSETICAHVKFSKKLWNGGRRAIQQPIRFKIFVGR